VRAQLNIEMSSIFYKFMVGEQVDAVVACGCACDVIAPLRSRRSTICARRT
jgi:hypothetical protein